MPASRGPVRLRLWPVQGPVPPGPLTSLSLQAGSHLQPTPGPLRPASDPQPPPRLLTLPSRQTKIPTPSLNGHRFTHPLPFFLPAEPRGTGSLGPTVRVPSTTPPPRPSLSPGPKPGPKSALQTQPLQATPLQTCSVTVASLQAEARARPPHAPFLPPPALYPPPWAVAGGKAGAEVAAGHKQQPQGACVPSTPHRRGGHLPGSPGPKAASRALWSEIKGSAVWPGRTSRALRPPASPSLPRPPAQASGTPPRFPLPSTAPSLEVCSELDHAPWPTCPPASPAQPWAERGSRGARGGLTCLRMACSSLLDHRSDRRSRAASAALGEELGGGQVT